MRSEIFAGSSPVQSPQRFALQNPQALRVGLGPDVLATKGSMVGYRGQVQFHHEKSGGVGKLAKKIVTSEDVSLMRVSGQGEVWFAAEAGYVHTLELENETLTLNFRNLLAFDSALTWDINRVKGAGIATGGFFNTTLSGSGVAAVTVVGQAMVLDCSQQPVYVDPQSSVCWSGNLVPSVHNSMNMKSMVRGGSGEAVQYAFHGPGFVVVQAYEWKPTSTNNSGGGGLIKNVSDLIP